MDQQPRLQRRRQLARLGQASTCQGGTSFMPTAAPLIPCSLAKPHPRRSDLRPQALPLLHENTDKPQSQKLVQPHTRPQAFGAPHMYTERDDFAPDNTNTSVALHRGLMSFTSENSLTRGNSGSAKRCGWKRGGGIGKVENHRLDKRQYRFAW